MYSNFLVWLNSSSGTVFAVMMMVIFYFSACIFKSISEDVERVSIKITNNILYLILTWGSVIFFSLLNGALVFNMEFPYAAQGGYYARSALVGKAISPVFAFWFFGRVVICFICYLAVKKRNKSANFFGKEGFKLISLRNR